MSATSKEFRKALSSDSTAAAFTAKTPSTTEPSGDAIKDLTSINFGTGALSQMPKFVVLMPYGTDADNEAFSVRVWGWNKVWAEDIWIPQLLLELDVTLGNIAATSLGTGSFLPDTLVIADGDADAAVISSTADVACQAILNIRGCRYLEFDFAKSTAAAMNCLWRAYDQD